MTEETFRTTPELLEELARLRRRVAELEAREAGRERTEQALRESEGNFRNFMDSSPLGIRVRNAERNLVYCNRAYLDIFGVASVEELEAVPMAEHYAPENYSGHLARRELRKQGKPIPSPYEVIIMRRGEVRHAAVYSKEFTWGGKPHDHALFEDITDRKLAEEELRKTNLLLSKTFSSLRDAVFVADARSRVIVTCNEAAERIFGYRKEEMIGRTTEFLYVSHEAFVEMGRNFLASLDRAGVFRDKYLMRRSDGTVFPTETVVTSVLDDSGNRTSLVGVIRDLSELERAENALLQSEKRSQMKSEILSNISHELKSPLTSIKGIIDSLLVKDITFDGRTRDMLMSGMSEEVDRLMRLITDLLSMSKIEAGVWTPEKSICQISDIIAEVVEQQSWAHGEREFNTDVARPLPPVNADPNQIRQVLTNLVANSLAYADEASPVTVSAKVVENAIEISVSDCGAGIAKEELEKIFEKFYRGARKDRAHGTGLGLAICRAIVEAHGGTIWAESEVGRGSTFRFRLPLPAAKEEAKKI